MNWYSKILEKYSLDGLSTIKTLLDEEINKLNLLDLKKEKDEKKKLNSSISKLKNYKIKEEKKLLNETKIICSTLNSAGHEMIIDAHLIFDYLIIDESAQSVEPLILVPLLNQIKKIILVGDQMQLPPTTFYPNSKNDLFTIK